MSVIQTSYMREIKSFLNSIAIVFTTVLFFNCASIPKLSKEDKKTIRHVVNTPIPEIIKGETKFAQSDGHKIWYENISPDVTNKGTVLLIMGNGQDALSWPPDFVENFTKAGYQVIRYDHRGTGLSESEEKWNRKKPYTLTDMANDAIAVLNSAAIKKSHIVGVSMGGMIAQIIAIEHTDRTASLTSIMSSGNVMDDELPPMSDEILPKMISVVLKKGFFGNKKGQIKRQIIQKRILMAKAKGAIDVKTISEVANYNLEEREGYHLMAARHHYAAILNSESRLEELRHLSVPTLVIHGEQDPVIPISHGKKLVATIPNADSLWIDNMGHDLPDAALKKMTDKIILNFVKISN